MNLNEKEYFELTDSFNQLYDPRFIEDDRKFENELKEEYSKLKNDNIWSKFFQAAYNVIEKRIKINEDWYKACFKKYSEMNFKFSSGKMTQDGEDEKLPLEKLSAERQQILVKSKVIGDFMENIVNYVLFNSIQDKNKPFIIDTPEIKRSTKGCHLYIVNEKEDRGIDTILYWPNENYSMCIQIKYRNLFNGSKLNVDELVSKMRNEMFSNESGKMIHYNCGYDLNKNNTFSLAINGGLDQILDVRYSYGITNDKKHRVYSNNKSLNADLTFFMDNIFFENIINKNDENLFSYFN